MFVFDLDGTLLNSKKEVSEKNRSALRELSRKGHKIIIATARPPRAINKKLKDLNIPLEMIYYNGAMTLSSDGNCVKHAINVQIFKELFDFVKQNDEDAIISIEADDEWFTCQHFDFPTFFKISDSPVILDEKLLLQKEPNKILINNHHCFEKLKEKFSDSLNMVVTDAGGLIQIMSKEASKEAGINDFSKLFNIPKDSIYCFGDDHNDIGMFKYCGHPVAMGNAIEDLKALAEFVTSTNDQDGVAEFISSEIFGN